LGQKVFQAKDYQRKGGVFRGYANVKGVVGKGKRLPSGTYFYVLKYKDKDKRPHQKSGYLYVR
ncbi:MAG: gliding motility-associated C-terminal domain-containing protein, partial [Capnocytophaga felis]|nr:gliding motility-associated C-terminal domain-containing protein [Capnocytophaga felis]